MQTYSHLLITAAISIPLVTAVNSKTSRTFTFPRANTKALLFGSVLPDLALIIIALVCIARDWLLGIFQSPTWQQFEISDQASAELMDLSWTVSLFDNWFFNNPIVISLQNTFHSPLVLILLIAICYFSWQQQNQVSNKNSDSAYSISFWVLCAALLHTFIDIPLHSTDGPLIFFPLDWSYRFASPVSYWDANYYGHIWAIFEHSVDFVMLLFLFFYWRKYRKSL